MLQLILGRAGSGKTSRVLNLLEEFIASGKDELILLVPEQYSFHTERAVLEKLGEKAADKIDVLSFTRLAHTVFAKYGGKSGARLDDAGRAILMSLALESVQGKLEVYGRHARSPALISQMLNVAHEFKHNAVSLSLLEETLEGMEESLLKQKLSEIALVLAAYEALVSAGYFDDHDELTGLYETLLKHPFFEGKTVLMDAFHWFTGQELKIIEMILAQADALYLTLCMDKLFPLDDDGLFAHTKQTASKLMRAAGKQGVSLAQPHLLPDDGDRNESSGSLRCSNEALCALEQGIYNPYAKAYEKETDALTLVSAADVAAECEYVAASIKKLLRRENYRCREIAIIARESKAYEAQMSAALKKCGVPVFVDERQSIITQPPIVLVRAALDIAANGFSIDSLMRALKTGLSNFTVEEISILENYALLWKIQGRKWLEDWVNHPQGYGKEMCDKDREDLTYINQLRKQAVTAFAAFNSKLKNTTGEGAAKAVYNLLLDLEVPENLKELAIELEGRGEPVLALELQRLWDDLMDLLDSFAETLQDRPVTARRISELFDLIIHKRSLGSLPQGIDEITIGSADRIRTSSPKAVFIVGANEGIFPKTPSSGGVLNDQDRRSLLELGLDVDEPGASAVKEERFIAYSALAAASDKLVVSYARKDMAGASLSPSEIVSGIKQLFQNCSVKDTTDTPDLFFVEGERPAFETMAKKMHEADELYSALRAYFNARADYAANLDALDRIAKNEPFKIKDKKAARALFGEDMTMSASRAENYFQCAFKYFCDYGLRVRARQTAEFDPLQSGTASHYVLEKLLEKFPGNSIKAVSQRQIKEEIKVALDSYIIEKMGGFDDKAPRFIYKYRRIALIVEDTVNRLLEELENCEFEPVALELEIAKNGDIKPYEISLPHGKKLEVCGSIDRVDKMQLEGKNFLRVIDYKSSGKAFDLARVLDGINMQMLIYLFALWQNGKSLFGELVPAGILYVATERPAVSLGRQATQAQLKKEQDKTKKMNGLVLEDEKVIRGMEKEAAGVFIPASISKGKLKGQLINLEQLIKLNKKTDTILSSMVEALQAGEIEALPAKLSGSYKSCDFCDYRAVCGFEEGMPTKPATKMKHEEVLQLLEEGE
ncbi:MAG: helicase [Clostridiales bacterium]|nr:helicase [Clostridiales bacterium]